MNYIKEDVGTACCKFKDVRFVHLQGAEDAFPDIACSCSSQRNLKDIETYVEKQILK